MKPIQLLKPSLFLCCALLSLHSMGQTTINAAGNSAKINDMTFDYSIGEMTIISTEKASNIIVTQGLLQPMPKNASPQDQAGHAATNNFADHLKVYPNPTENMLFIETIDALAGEFSYQLFDASGKVVLSQKEQQVKGSNKFSLSLASYAAGSYFLMVNQINADGTNSRMSYKIQKTK